VKRLLSSIAVVLLALFALAPIPLLLTGCQSSPQAVAYKSADAIASSVRIGMSAWYDHLVAEEHRIAALPPLDRGTQAANLLRKEGRVMNAYAAYQNAVAAAKPLVTSTGTNRIQGVATAAADLLALIQTLQKP